MTVRRKGAGQGCITAEGSLEDYSSHCGVLLSLSRIEAGEVRQWHMDCFERLPDGRLDVSWPVESWLPILPSFGVVWEF